MSSDTTASFDRMRGILMRAAEIRDSEQQQIFDSLDEIQARLSALDALGTVRKRLSELPDRTEVGVLAERLDETVAKLDAQDSALAAVARALEALPDKLGRPIAALDGRLDGMAGRLEGVAGRMDGLDDRLGGMLKRLDDIDNRLGRHETRIDALPASVGERVDGAVDGLAPRLEALAGKVATVEEGVGRLDASLTDRPDAASLTGLVERANEESERRSAGRLDEAMATFAELILGRGAAVQQPAAPARPVQRRTRARAGAGAPTNGLPPGSTPDDGPYN